MFAGKSKGVTYSWKQRSRQSLNDKSSEGELKMICQIHVLQNTYPQGSQWLTIQTEDCRLRTTESADRAVQTENIFSNNWHNSFRFCSYKIEFCILSLVVAWSGKSTLLSNLFRYVIILWSMNVFSLSDLFRASFPLHYCHSFREKHFCEVLFALKVSRYFFLAPA